MGLFNFFNKHNSSPQPEQTPSASEQPNQWDSLAAVPFDQATPAPEAAPRPTEGNAQRIQRQGGKIIASFLYSPSVLNSKTVDISDADRERFYDAIADGAITPAQQSEFLRNIALPIGPPNHENPAPVMQKLSTDRLYLKILAYTGGLGAETTNNIKPGMPATEQFTITLQNLLQQYPTPIEFAEREQYMMDRLRNAGNTPAKLAPTANVTNTSKPSKPSRALPIPAPNPVSMLPLPPNSSTAPSNSEHLSLHLKSKSTTTPTWLLKPANITPPRTIILANSYCLFKAFAV